MWQLVLSGFIFMQVIAIGPNDVMPGSWFIPSNVKSEQVKAAEKEAFDQLVCAIGSKDIPCK